MPRAPLLHALVLVILAIGASDAKRLSASSNETASNETALTQPASNETALKQAASNETSLNQTRLALDYHESKTSWNPDTGHWTTQYTHNSPEKDLCVEEQGQDPCRTICKCIHVEGFNGVELRCRWNITKCRKRKLPCYNARKKKGDCCESCPNGHTCLVWGRLLQPGDIWQNPGNQSEYATCGKTRLRITEITEDERSGFPTFLSHKYPPGGRYP